MWAMQYVHFLVIIQILNAIDIAAMIIDIVDRNPSISFKRQFELELKFHEG